MKKVLLTILTVLLLVSMLSCGEKPANTSDGASGTNTETTGEAPDNKLPDNTDYSKAVGTRFEFMLSAESYFGTEYNAQGNPLVRRVYDFETMQQGTDPILFVYEYDAKGVLKGYSVKVDPFSELTPLTVTYDENGRAVSAEARKKSEVVAASWEYDKNGLIVCETLDLDGGHMTFMYDNKGRIVKEMVDFGDGYEARCVNTYTKDGMHQVATAEDEIVVDAKYTFDAEGYPLTVKGNIDGDEMEIAYTYNDKMLCTSSLIKSEYGSFKTETVYNDKELVASLAMTSYDEDGKQTDKRVWEYSYNGNGKVASETESYYNENDKLEDKRVSLYEYDAKGNIIKEDWSSYQDNKLMNRSVATWLYDDKNQLIETTSVYYNDRGEVENHSSMVFAYDAKGNCVKETETVYTPEGTVYETRVQVVTYNDKNICVKTEDHLYNAQNQLKHHEIREYDENGNEIKKISYRIDTDKENVTHQNGRTEDIYTYDENGWRTKQDRTEYDADGKMVSRTVTEYKDGELYKFTEYDANGNVVRTEDYSDKNGPGEAMRPDEDESATDPNVGTKPEEEKDPSADTHPEEKPEEYLPGVDYNGDGMIDENDLPGGSTSDNNGMAPDGGSIEESLNQSAPNAGMVDDPNRTDSNR